MNDATTTITYQEITPEDIRLSQDGTIMVHGRTLETTDRFRRSYYQLYRLSSDILQYFSPLEVSDRVGMRHPDQRVRLTVDEERCQVLGLSDASQPILQMEQAEEIISDWVRRRGLSIHGWDVYDGNIRCQLFDASDRIQLGPDYFARGYNLIVPIDGSADPSTGSAILREICTNGMLGLHHEFTEHARVLTKENPQALYARHLESLGYDGHRMSRMVERVQANSKNLASVREAVSFRHLLESVPESAYFEVSREHVLSVLDEHMGDTFGRYGPVGHSQGVQASRLPTTMGRWNLLNLATELASHHLQDSAADMLQAWQSARSARGADLPETTYTGSLVGRFFGEN